MGAAGGSAGGRCGDTSEQGGPVRGGARAPVGFRVFRLWQREGLLARAARLGTTGAAPGG